MRDLLRQLTMDDLHGNDRDMAEVIGLDAYIKLSEVYGGTTPYIAVSEKLEYRVAKRLATEEYDGTNAAQLARRYGMSERYVQRLVAAKDKELRNRPDDNQISIYDI